MTEIKRRILKKILIILITVTFVLILYKMKELHLHQPHVSGFGRPFMGPINGLVIHTPEDSAEVFGGDAGVCC